MRTSSRGAHTGPPHYFDGASAIDFKVSIFPPGRVMSSYPREFAPTWVLILIAAASMDHFVPLFGKRWKQLQRWILIAATLTLITWTALHDWDGVGPTIVHFFPLGLLETYRALYRARQRSLISKGQPMTDEAVPLFAAKAPVMVTLEAEKEISGARAADQKASRSIKPNRSAKLSLSLGRHWSQNI